MCAAYCAASNDTNDEDNRDGDRCKTPSRAIPRHVRDGMLGNILILQLPLLLVCR
jgi:hypothetical protein